MKNIGVIGAGVMGTGLSQSLSQAKYNVVLIDISQDALDKSRNQILQNVRLQSLFKKENKDNPKEVIERIKFVTNYDLFDNIDFLIENAAEKWDIKKNIYLEIDKICPKECIFAVNTSCISITKIAALTKRPTQIIGTHFMNPVPMIPAVEVIKGFYTSDETIEQTNQLIESLGKESIIVNDSPGFVSNRLSHLFMNEAAFLVQEQVASPAEIDDIFKKCYSHKLGPLETADLIGLDTVVNSLEVLYEDFQDSKFRCCPLLRKMVEAGLYGRKTGKGFYNY